LQSGNELFGRLLGRLLRGLTELPLATRNAPSNAEDGALRLAQAAPKLHGWRDPEVDSLRHGFVLVLRVRSAPRGESALRLYALLGRSREPDPKHPGRPQEPDRRRIAFAEGSGACAGALASPLSAPRRVGSPRLGSRAGRCSQVRTAPLGRHTFQCCERK
jgi:hypothetical protein